MPTENNTPAGGTPPAQAPAQDTPGSSVQEIFNYDPFEPPKAGLQEQNEPGPEHTTTVEGVVPQAQAPQAPAEAPQTVPLEKFQELEARLAAMEAARQQQQYQPPQQQQNYAPQGQPQGPQGQPQAPAQGQAPQRRYGYQVPNEIFAGLNHEDPNIRNQTLTTVLNGVSEIIHDTVMREVNARVEALMAEIPQQTQQTVQRTQEAQAVFNDFYGAWPELNNPTFHQLVGMVAAEIGSKPGKQWNPATRDEIGREVYKRLKWPIPGQRQNAPKPPAQSSSSARPGAPAPLTDQQNRRVWKTLKKKALRAKRCFLPATV